MTTWERFQRWRERRSRRLRVISFEGRVTVIGSTPRSAIDQWPPDDPGPSTVLL